MKYRHLFDEALGLSGADLAVLAVLMLRGAQTPGELRTRTERLHRFDSFDELDAVIERLIERELVARLERRPGQKEQRYAHLLGGDTAEAEPAAAPPADDRLAELERELAELREEVAALRDELRRR